MQDEPLNKCPVCYGIAKLYRKSNKNPFGFFVECKKCYPPSLKKFVIDLNTITAISLLNSETRLNISKNIVEESYVNEEDEFLSINENNLEDYKKIKPKWEI